MKTKLLILGLFIICSCNYNESIEKINKRLDSLEKVKVDTVIVLTPKETVIVKDSIIITTIIKPPKMDKLFKVKIRTSLDGVYPREYGFSKEIYEYMGNSTATDNTHTIDGIAHHAWTTVVGRNIKTGKIHEFEISQVYFINEQ